MKVLILSCATGGGHNSAAAALCEYFEKQGFRVICPACSGWQHTESPAFFVLFSVFCAIRKNFASAVRATHNPANSA